MAVPIVWKFRTIVVTEAGQEFDYTASVATGDSVESAVVSIPASTTQEIDIAFDYTKLKAYFLLSDKNCTLKTNSSGSPDETIALVAGVPQFFPGATNLFGHAVTKMFGINGAGAAANITIKALVDSTP